MLFCKIFFFNCPKPNKQKNVQKKCCLDKLSIIEHNEDLNKMYGDNVSHPADACLVSISGRLR